MANQEPVQTPDGEPFALQFYKGLPPVFFGPALFLLKDGSVHCGDLVWTKNALSPTGQSRVLRTTNPVGGFHEKFDIPECKIIGHAYAGPHFAHELPSAY